MALNFQVQDQFFLGHEIFRGEWTADGTYTFK